MSARRENTGGPFDSPGFLSDKRPETENVASFSQRLGPPFSSMRLLS